MINKAHFPKFRVSELLQYFNDALSICDKNNPVQLQITDKVEIARASVVALEGTFKLDQASALSAELLALDQRRDACLTGIRMFADACTYHFDAAKLTAATSIVTSIDKYGKNLVRMNYQAETSTIKSITDSWINDSKLASALELLQLNDWVAELKLSNELFNKAYLARVEEKSVAPQTNSGIELRKLAVDAFRELTNNIYARATLTPVIYDALISQLNVLTDKYNQLVDSRAATTTKPSTSIL